MKVCCLLCQFNHHSLIEELIYAHILTHSLRDLLPEQRLLNDFCISQLFHKRLKDEASRQLQRLQNKYRILLIENLRKKFKLKMD